MSGKCLDVIIINVLILQNELDPNSYKWYYQSDYNDVDEQTGTVTIHNESPLLLIYRLDKISAEKYELIYANMDAIRCATREVRQVLYSGNSAIIHMANKVPLVQDATMVENRYTEFRLRLVARLLGDVNSAIISPDPEVVNDPIAR